MNNAVKQTACVPAVFLPFNMAALPLKIPTGAEAGPAGIRNRVQCAGGEAVAGPGKEPADLENGLPAAGEPESEIAIPPLLTGGDGVTVPFRPDGGGPEGKTVWKEAEAGIFARPGSRISRKGGEISFPARKRVTAVSGDTEDFNPVCGLHH